MSDERSNFAQKREQEQVFASSFVADVLLPAVNKAQESNPLNRLSTFDLLEPLIQEYSLRTGQSCGSHAIWVAVNHGIIEAADRGERDRERFLRGVQEDVVNWQDAQAQYNHGHNYRSMPVTAEFSARGSYTLEGLMECKRMVARRIRDVKKQQERNREKGESALSRGRVRVETFMQEHGIENRRQLYDFLIGEGNGDYSS
jgi:hypothetical protein